MCLGDRQRAQRIEDISRVTAGAFRNFENAFAEQIGGGNFLSDTSPEEKAAELISMSDTHYKQERDLSNK